ncbi:unnamed protein product, partial [Adineta steineri]
MMDSIPYDRYCVSIKQDIQRRVCSLCSLYFSSIAAMKKHKTVHSTQFKKNQMLIIDDNEDQDEEMKDEQVNDNEASAPIIYNIFDFLQSDFVQFKENE